MLTQLERIALSKRIVKIPTDIATANIVKDQLQVEKSKAQNLDDAHSSLISDLNFYVHGYGDENSYIDGNERRHVLEQDQIDAVKKVFKNGFFPNDPLVAPPGVPDGVWKFFPPYSGAYAIGKKYNGVYNIIDGEQPLYASITSTMTTIETHTDINRVTGQVCALDIISTDSVIHGLLTTLEDLVQRYEDTLNSEFAAIITDTDSGRNTQNLAAKNDITVNILPAINTWQAYVDFNTAHGETTCVGFNGHDPNSLGSTKLRVTELDALKAALLARQSFLSGTRIPQLTANLGTTGQNLTTGELDGSGSGFFDSRFKIFDLRLNVIGGSLAKVVGLQAGIDTQDQLIANSTSAQNTYSTIMLAVRFRSPSVGVNIVHILNSTGFSVSDSVYVVADDQSEILTTITGISGNTVTLANNIPQKYTKENFSRIYKVL